MKNIAIPCLILVLVAAAGCGAGETTTDDPAVPAAESVKAPPPAEAVPEVYEVVDPAELAFSIEDFYYDGVVTEEGMQPTGGEVGTFTCEGQVLELETPEFVDGFIVTKDYGKIKILFTTSLSGGSFSVSLKPSQKEALTALKANP